MPSQSSSRLPVRFSKGSTANPRGSSGYGYELQRANFQDWGEGPAGDVLAVVDQVALNDWIDEDRLVVTGGSYAGYLTAWIVGHDHRFRAAVAQRGVYDIATFFGEGNAWQLVEYAMGGYPFDARYRDVINRNSPLTYVNRIRTPLLIMHASRRKVRKESIPSNLAVSLTCPRCAAEQTLPLGLTACRACRFALMIEVDEPRCECGYLLYRLSGMTCPECGRVIPDAQRWGTWEEAAELEAES